MLAHVAPEWHIDVISLLPLLLLMIIYLQGALRLHQRRQLPMWQVGTFAIAVIWLSIALLSPLEALSHTLLTAHMLQHLIVLVIVPPLLILSKAILPLLWGFSFQQRKQMIRVLRWLHLPVWGWLLHAGVMWLWHLPKLYTAALNHPLLHWLEHSTFLGTALLYWWVLIYPPRLNYVVSAFSAFAMMLQCGFLGMLMTFASRPWYAHYQGGYGLTTLEDQQMAGLLMWLPTGLVYLLAAVVLLYHMLERQPGVRFENEV